MNNCRCASLVRTSCCLCPRQVKDMLQTYFQPRLGKMVGNRTFGSKLSLSTVTRKLYGTHKFSVVFHASWLPCPIFILFQSCMEVTVTWKLGKFIKLPICPILVGISPEGVAKYSNIVYLKTCGLFVWLLAKGAALILGKWAGLNVVSSLMWIGPLFERTGGCRDAGMVDVKVGNGSKVHGFCAKIAGLILER